VNIPAHVFFGMVHEVVDVILVEAGVASQFIGEQFRAAHDVRPYLFLQGLLLAVRNVLDVNLSSLSIQQTDNQFLACPALPVIFTAFLSLCMKRASPPIMVSSASTGPPVPNFSKLPRCIAKRMRWSMNHAVF
jgi:hypothetical protein